MLDSEISKTKLLFSEYQHFFARPSDPYKFSFYTQVWEKKYINGFQTFITKKKNT